MQEKSRPKTVCEGASAMTQAHAPALAQEGAVARQFLEGGEVIHLAIRPSLWFVPLVSAPLVVAAAFPAIVAHLAGPRVGLSVPPYALVLLWAMAAMTRLFAGSLQWLGRLYVLTNRRLITVRGVARFRVHQCPLAKVGGVGLAATGAERVLGLGTLCFDVPPGAEAVGPWVNLARPAGVRHEIEQAIRRCVG
jgi:hypothetical protein